MLKKILLAGSLFFLALFFIGGAALAQEDTDVTTSETSEAIEDIQEPFLSPDSPFYFLQQWRERIEIFFARSDEARTNLELKHAQRRVGEIKHLVRVNREDLLEKVRERWQVHLEIAQERVENVVAEKREEVREQVLEATSKHLVVLEKVYEQAPEQAKEGLQRAIDNAGRYQEVILERFSPEKVETLREEVETKIEQFREKHNLLEERFEIIVPGEKGEE